MTVSFTAITLASGKMEFVPEALIYLNPESQGCAQYLYFVWPFKADEPVTLEEAVTGQAKTPLFGYFTNHLDLCKMGQRDKGREYTHCQELSDEYLDMTQRVLDKIEPLHGVGETWTYAFCLCDSMAGDVPVGVAHGFEKMMPYE